MPIFRRPTDGSVVEELTEKNGKNVDPLQDQATRPLRRPRAGVEQVSTSAEGDDTVPLSRQKKNEGVSTIEEVGRTEIDPPTRIMRRARSKNKTVEASAVAPKSDPMADPVVGWLVIVDGPGRGNVLNIGYGMNAIGRNASERICLDFGDELISRSQHAMVTYEPRSRKYYVSHGGGTNLTYLGDIPVLSPMELPAGSNIQVGDTILMFMPLCSESFDWQDLENSGS